jgi:hypothetical protein
MIQHRPKNLLAVFVLQMFHDAVPLNALIPIEYDVKEIKTDKIRQLAYRWMSE